LHEGSEFEPWDDGRLGQHLALDLCGEKQVLLIFVALAAHLSGEAGALFGDEADEETDDEETSEGDDEADDADVGAVADGAEELLQDGAEDGECDRNWKRVDEGAEGDGKNVEVAEGDVSYDNPVGVGYGDYSENDYQVE